MAKRMSGDLRRYAVVGAEQRLLQLAEEAAKIFAIFPELRAPGRGFMAVRQGQGRGAVAASTVPRAGRRRRRKLSADARKRISDAQKKRWAKHRKSART
jgi:hypothetical protein